MFGGLPLGELRSTGKDMVLGRPELWGFGDKGQREGGQKGSVEWTRMASGRTGQFYGLTEVVLHWGVHKQCSCSKCTDYVQGNYICLCNVRLQRIRLGRGPQKDASE